MAAERPCAPPQWRCRALVPAARRAWPPPTPPGARACLRGGLQLAQGHAARLDDGLQLRLQLPRLDGQRRVGVRRQPREGLRAGQGPGGEGSPRSQGQGRRCYGGGAFLPLPPAPTAPAPPCLSAPTVRTSPAAGAAPPGSARSWGTAAACRCARAWAPTPGAARGPKGRPWPLPGPCRSRAPAATAAQASWGAGHVG